MGAEDEGKRKRSLPRIKFVPRSTGSRQWREQRGLGESQQGPRTQKLLPGARADTQSQSPTPLCSRLEFLSLARWLSRSLLSTPPPGRSVKAKSFSPRVLPAEGRGTPRAWLFAGLRTRPGSSARAPTAWVPPPSPAPQVSRRASPPLLLLPRPAGAEKLPICVASPPPPFPRLQLSLAARWGGGGGPRVGGGD